MKLQKLLQNKVSDRKGVGIWKGVEFGWMLRVGGRAGFPLTRSQMEGRKDFCCLLY